MQKQPLNEQQLQALLRLKRHEQPPPGYFDDLLAAVHRRQREELLRRPAWRIFLDRIGAFLSPLRTDWATAGTMAGILLIGIGAIQMALPKRVPVQQVNVATMPLATPQPAIAENVPFELGGKNSKAVRTELRDQSPRAGSINGPTRFVLDAQPVSYEPPVQIRF